MNAGSNDGDSLVQAIISTAPCDLDAQVAEERKEVADYVRSYPCPSEDQVLEWLQDAARGGKLDSTSLPLKMVLVEYSLKGTLTFDYQAFKDIYEAPLNVERGGERAAVVSAGRKLAENGGQKALLLHYALVNCAFNSGYFHPGADRSVPVRLYMRSVEYEWDDAGLWRA